MRITVFTPTYNRGYIIENLYKSLKKQTFKDFEWLVLDDGSTDNTEELFKKWIKEENFFNIVYKKTENGGKHRAINKASDIARGDLFFIVDSDDRLTNDALEVLDKWEKSIINKEKFCAISGNRGRNTGDMWGATFKGTYFDCTALERRKNNILGDKAEAYYTSILKKYKFPEFYGENFITEAVLWNRIAEEGYQIRWFNKVIYISDYLEDGLTSKGDILFKNNPKGTAYYIRQNIKYDNQKIFQRLSTYNAYYELVKEDIKLREIANNLQTSRLILIISIVLAKVYRSIRRMK